MITGSDAYHVLSAVVPLYFAIGLGFASVRLFRILTPEQVAGVNRVVALVAVPVLGFQFIAETNLYHIEYFFILADTVSKALVLASLLAAAFWAPKRWLRRFTLSSAHRLRAWAYDWSLTIFMVATLPNTLIIGVPVLTAMYGARAGDLIAQIVVAQVIIWYSFLIVAFECRAAISESVRVLSISPRLAELTAVMEVDEYQTPSTLSMALPPPLEAATKVQSPCGEEASSGPASDQASSCNSMGHGGSDQGDMNGVESGVDGEAGHKEPEEITSKGGRGVASVSFAEASSRSRAALRPKSSWRLKLKILARKLIANPNMYSSTLGIAYSLLSFGFDFGMPLMLRNTLDIISRTGLGMSMYSLGLFMGSQNTLVPCGACIAAWTLATRFIAGPALMAGISTACGLRGDTLRIATLQAALPQGIVAFVFANEYKVHAEVLSTGVSLGTVISIPILIVYYILFGLGTYSVDDAGQSWRSAIFKVCPPLRPAAATLPLLDANQQSLGSDANQDNSDDGRSCEVSAWHTADSRPHVLIAVLVSKVHGFRAEWAAKEALVAARHIDQELEPRYTQNVHSTSLIIE
eukprot:SM000326S12431  [mRNA]  locus=s326:95778:100628:+ [translate_table: standard]